jgi:hypothetical protein
MTDVMSQLQKVKMQDEGLVEKMQLGSKQVDDDMIGHSFRVFKYPVTTMFNSLYSYYPISQ